MSLSMTRNSCIAGGRIDTPDQRSGIHGSIRESLGYLAMYSILGLTRLRSATGCIMLRCDGENQKNIPSYIIIMHDKILR